MNGLKKLEGCDYRWICRVSTNTNINRNSKILYEYVNVREAIESQLVKEAIGKKNIVFMNMRSSLECNSQ